jgi:hypothetical protein
MAGKVMAGTGGENLNLVRTFNLSGSKSVMIFQNATTRAWSAVLNGNSPLHLMDNERAWEVLRRPNFATSNKISVEVDGGGRIQLGYIPLQVCEAYKSGDIDKTCNLLETAQYDKTSFDLEGKVAALRLKCQALEDGWKGKALSKDEAQKGVQKMQDEVLLMDAVYHDIRSDIHVNILGLKAGSRYENQLCKALSPWIFTFKDFKEVEERVFAMKLQIMGGNEIVDPKNQPVKEPEDDKCVVS